MDTVGIVGAGQMGSGIAEVVAVAGVRALVHEPHDAPLHGSEQRIGASLARAVDRGKLAPQDAAEAADRITFTTQIDDLAACQLVVEAVTEDRAIKCDGLPPARRAAAARRDPRLEHVVDPDHHPGRRRRRARTGCWGCTSSRRSR